MAIHVYTRVRTRVYTVCTRVLHVYVHVCTRVSTSIAIACYCMGLQLPVLQYRINKLKIELGFQHTFIYCNIIYIWQLLQYYGIALLLILNTQGCMKKGYPIFIHPWSTRVLHVYRNRSTCTLVFVCFFCFSVACKSTTLAILQYGHMPYRYRYSTYSSVHVYVHVYSCTTRAQHDITNNDHVD